MAHINLLPWREERRKEQKKEFAVLSMLCMALAGLVVLYAHLHIGALIDQQNARNTYLQSQIAELDARIKEIKDLEDTKAKLQARINIIQQLQRSRPVVVHLFDELTRTLPDGVYLSSVEQKDNAIVLTGVAQSNARVSAYMRNVDASKWIGVPKLEQIEAKKQDTSARSNNFILHVSQPKDDDDQAAANAGKAGAPGKAKPATAKASAGGKP